MHERAAAPGSVALPRRTIVAPAAAPSRLVAYLALGVVSLCTVLSGCRRDDTAKPGAGYQSAINPDEAVDEAKGGKTLRGTPVTRRTPECFPAEPRDLFWRMDWVVDRNGKLGPLDFDENGDGVVDDAERNAIRGRNTWLLWGGGNEAFWGWLQEQGYGLEDLLILLDSRTRGTRFHRAGLINQPGFETSKEQILGLYLDRAKPHGAAMLRPPGAKGDVDGSDYEPRYDEPEPELYDAQGRRLREPVYRPALPANHPTRLFEPWMTSEEWKRLGDGQKDPSLEAYIPDVVRGRLGQDGLDPTIYGYPSGIFGLRLMLNPDFFARTDDAARARTYWKERVEKTNGRYYTDPDINADPTLVRPFRVSMSCGFCHVAPHPLNPPDDPENPEWENLSGVIGDQYWDPQPAFGNLLRRQSFLHHFLRSQAPGTIDTSLISTDHINNTNVINAVFDVPARLTRARNKPTETQSRENLLLPSLEDPGNTGSERHFPMVLFPGEDSIGVFGALARVPLNIGVFSEEWARSDNPIVGFAPQHPFRIEVGRSNSVYWNVNEKYRVGYMADFFTLGTKGIVTKSTAPMKLKDAPGGRAELLRDQAASRAHGRDVFIDHCAICHSSKQPTGFGLLFERDIGGGWENAPVPKEPTRLVYTLPMEYAHWAEFKKSAAYRDYVAHLRAMPEVSAPPDDTIDGRDRFIWENFLSNELRIPVTLVGTYSGRAMATNAMRGQVWDNYSSETFKGLKSVGKIRFYNPFLEHPEQANVDPEFGTNDAYSDGRDHGGPGYYRPASLISLWATAPYFHNNELGMYTHDPSVRGRMLAFDDGIRKLLWKSCRSIPLAGENTHCPHDGAFPPPNDGDLRRTSPAAKGDPGYIYRLPVDAEIAFAPGFIRPLIEGVLVGNFGPFVGRFLFSVFSVWLWVGLVLLFVWGAIRGRARHAGILLLGTALLVAVVLAVTGAGGAGGTVSGALMLMGTVSAMYYPPIWLWCVVAVLALLGVALLLTRWEARGFSRALFLVFAVGVVLAGFRTNGFLLGHRGPIKVGPIPRGVPVNLLMNIDPEKSDKVPAAVVGLVRALGEIKRRGLTAEAAYEVFRAKAGPALIAASKCPDMVLDRGHWFGEALGDDDKESLIAFLKTL